MAANLKFFIKSKTVLKTLVILLYYFGWEIFSFIVCEYLLPVYREVCVASSASFEKSFNTELFISLNLTSLAVLYIIMPGINRYIERKLKKEPFSSSSFD